jgi:hypothetical protein
MPNVNFILGFITLNMTWHQFFCDVTMRQFAFGPLFFQTKFWSHPQGSTFEDETNNLDNIYNIATELIMFRDP